MFKLTPIQAMHFPSVLWFLSSSRAIGKTDLLAYSYLYTASNNPNRSYEIIDFPNNHYHSRRILLERIVSLAKQFNLDIQISQINMSFKIKNVNPHICEEIQKAIGW